MIDGLKIGSSLKKWVSENFSADPRAQTPTGSDVELALAALLVELARADFSEDPQEFAVIRALLKRYLPNSERIEALLGEAGLRADRAVSLHEFTRQLNLEFSEPKKLEVVEMLWRVSLADGRIDAHEGHLVRKVAGLLHVRERDLVRLKIKVEEEIRA